MRPLHCCIVSAVPQSFLALQRFLCTSVAERCRVSGAPGALIQRSSREWLKRIVALVALIGRAVVASAAPICEIACALESSDAFASAQHAGLQAHVELGHHDSKPSHD